MLNENPVKTFEEIRLEDISRMVVQARTRPRRSQPDDRPISAKQLKFLESYGRRVTADAGPLEELTKGEASKLIEQVHSHKATPEQAKLLVREGYSEESVREMSKLQATITIGKITRITPAQVQALEAAGISVSELRANGIYLTKTEGSRMLKEIYSATN